MDKQKIYEILQSKTCGMEETCLGLMHGNYELNTDDIEYIRDACEEMLNALENLEKLEKGNE